jgi:hypothetical protein
LGGDFGFAYYAIWPNKCRQGSKMTNQIVSFEGGRRMMWAIPVRIYLVRDHSKLGSRKFWIS